MNPESVMLNLFQHLFRAGLFQHLIKQTLKSLDPEINSGPGSDNKRFFQHPMKILQPFLVLFSILFSLTGCGNIRYVSKLGWHQAFITFRSIPVQEVLEDEGMNAEAKNLFSMSSPPVKRIDYNPITGTSPSQAGWNIKVFSPGRVL